MIPGWSEKVENEIGKKSIQSGKTVGTNRTTSRTQSRKKVPGWSPDGPHPTPWTAGLRRQRHHALGNAAGNATTLSATQQTTPPHSRQSNRQRNRQRSKDKKGRGLRPRYKMGGRGLRPRPPILYFLFYLCCVVCCVACCVACRVVALSAALPAAWWRCLPRCRERGGVACEGRPGLGHREYYVFAGSQQ